MPRWIVSTLALVLAAGLAGCQNRTADSGDGAVAPMNASADACDHCAGTQVMTTDGRCPACAAKVDACPHCTGQQKLTADGKCPVCQLTMSPAPAGGAAPPPATRPVAP